MVNIFGCFWQVFDQLFGQNIKYLAKICRLSRLWCVHNESKRVKVRADEGERLSRVVVLDKMLPPISQTGFLHFNRVKVLTLLRRDSGVETPSRWLQVGNLIKLGTLLPPVDPVHEVFYVPNTWVASLQPLWAFQVEVVLVGGRWETGWTETGR